MGSRLDVGVRQSVTAGRLAELVGLMTGTIAQMLIRLEDAGLVHSVSVSIATASGR